MSQQEEPLRILVMLAIVLSAGCAPTRYPMLLRSSLVRTTDRMARDAMSALARKDAAALAKLGMEEAKIKAALAESPQLSVSSEPKFLLDYPIATSYIRQYAVALATSGEIEIRVGFKDDKNPRVTHFQFLERASSNAAK